MPKQNKDKPTYQTEINAILADMALTDTTSEDYQKQLDAVERLHKMNTQNKGRTQVSADTIVTASASLLGIVAILGFERAHVITSKALGFVMKLK